MSFDKLTESIAISIIRNVITKIESYIQLIQPSKTVIIAFDGVAPVAKLEQQRSRRYKSWYQNNISRDIFKKVEPDAWNTAAITPGTIFMSELNNMVSTHFFSDSNHINIIVNGSNKSGEGEHKLFDYIRLNPEKHLKETTVIYGLDADLIMLSINHLPVCPSIYLFRETPHFIQSINRDLEPDSNYFLDIPELTETIINYMNNEKRSSLTKRENTTITTNKNKVYDYIFLCFFLGNDFLPHFPAINIRTGGIDKMLNAYRATIGVNENLTDGKTINWANVRKIVTFLANLEEQYIIDEVEKFINPFKPYWQNRYYRALFDIKTDTTGQQRRDVVINYLEGLEWTMKYYTSGCPDWRWRYKYNYPPLLQDLIKHVPVFSTEFVIQKPKNPVTEIVQLCYVLPRNSLALLPKILHEQLLEKHSDWYKNDSEFVWAYCRYFWESHVNMNEIDINELEQFILANKKTFI